MTAATYITTSWDDGHPLDLRIAEMLRANGLSGTFYVPRTAATGTMSASEIRQLATSFEIGAHTLNHIALTGLTRQDARSEIEGSRSWVEDVTGRSCDSFCAPLGRFAPEHLRMAAEAGFKVFRTVEMMSLDLPRRCGGVHVVPTTLQAHPQPAVAMLKNVIKRRRLMNLGLYLRHGRGDWPDALDGLSEVVRKHGGVLHLWGHSWEIERHGQWNALARALQRLGCLARAGTVVTNGQLISASTPRVPVTAVG